MGRWAGRTRSGGGVNQPAFMLTVERSDDTHLVVTYNRAVTPAIASNFSFEGNPSGSFGDTVTQSGPTALNVETAGDFSTDTTLTYHGTAANVLYPQTLAIS